VRFTVTHFIMGIFYGIVFVLCVKWRIRPYNENEPPKNRFWRDWFTFLLLNGALTRGIWSVSQPFWYSGYITWPSTINIYFNVIPSFLFMGNYLLILFFWMEVYYSYGTNMVDLKNFFIVLFGSMCLFLTVLILFDIWFYPVPAFFSERVPRFNKSVSRLLMINFVGACYVVISISFLYYGIRLYWRFRSVQQRELIHKVRAVILPRVKILTGLCWSCFIIRGALVIWNATSDFFSTNGKGWPDEIFWWVDFIYYSLLEIMPLFFMLLIFKSPGEKESSSIKIYSQDN